MRARRTYRSRLMMRGILIMVLAGVVLSTGGPIIRQIEAASGFQIVFWRSVAQSILIFLILMVRDRGGIGKVFLGLGWPGLSGSLFLGLAFFGFVFSITSTTVANTLFLISTTPFFAAILAWPVLKERVSRPTWVAIVAASVGVIIMVSQGLNTGRLFGNVMGIFCAFATALYVISVRYGSVRAERTDMVPVVCVAGLIAALTAVFIEDGNIWISNNDLFWCVVAGTVQNGPGFMLYTMGSRYVPAAELSLLGLIEVIIGPIWVWLLLSEIPDMHTLVGGAVILVAVSGLAFWSIYQSRPDLG